MVKHNIKPYETANEVSIKLNETASLRALKP